MKKTFAEIKSQMHICNSWIPFVHLQNWKDKCEFESHFHHHHLHPNLETSNHIYANVNQIWIPKTSRQMGCMNNESQTWKTFWIPNLHHFLNLHPKIICDCESQIHQSSCISKNIMKINHGFKSFRLKKQGK